MADKSPSPNYSCEICGASNLSDDKMRTHIIECHLQNTLICPICDIISVSTQDMLDHVNNHHLDYLTPDQDIKAFIDEDFKVKSGSSHGVSQQGCDVNGIHIKITSPKKDCGPVNNVNLSKPETCRIGGAGSNSPKRLNLDLKLPKVRPKFSPSPLKMCPVAMCSFKSENTREMELHINQHFDPKSPKPCEYECFFCDKSFKISSDLELHVNIEHNDILSPGKPQTPTCPVCCISMKNLSHLEQAQHVEQHYVQSRGSTPMTPSTKNLVQTLEKENREQANRKLQEQQEFELLRAQYGMDNDGNFIQQSMENMEKAVFSGEMSVADYYERRIFLRNAESNGFDDCSSCTKDIVEPIKSASLESRNVNQTLTCTTLDHYASTFGDKGWGCGFRNIQMMLSALLYHTGYNSQIYRLWVLSNSKQVEPPPRGTMPSISRIQTHIEWAWRQGFDVQGADQLGFSLVKTRKWIGATELFTFLSSLRIRCQLIDFHQPSSSDGCHPELFNWVLEYFSNGDDFKPPLYLQHQGHSRTIMGVEQLKDGSLHLLILDPSHSTQQMSQCKDRKKVQNCLRLLRKSSQQMKAPQYQIVAVTGIMENDSEYQQSKIIKSIRVPQDR